jgi:putative transcriptional regulator
MEINPLDYTITELNKLSAKKGRFLIAEPFMDDPYFKRSVVLLTEHNIKGTFGFILNKPLDVFVNDILKDFPTFESPIFMGGPVQPDTLFFIHTQGDLIAESIQVKDNIYWSGNMEQLKQLIIDQQIFPNEVMFFIGYSGWDAMQLKNEIKEESWIIAAPELKNIQQLNSTDLWRKSLQKMGSKHSLLANFPEDPSLN